MAVLGAAVAVVVDAPVEPRIVVQQSSTQVEVASAPASVIAGVKPPTTVSRSAERPPLTSPKVVEAKITGKRYATVELAVRADSKKSSPELATVGFGKTVDITDKTDGDFTQIVHKGAPRWVTTAYLSKDVPEKPLGTAPCAAGSGVEGGLQTDTVKVYRAVCAKFPQITNYGGIAGRGEHATGHSLDIMVSSDVGTQIATYLQENRAELGIEYLIWRQRIWRPATSPNWRGMSNRGGATANHMDHVHVTTYGSAATS